MELILSAVIALNIGLYELPPVDYTSGVAGAKKSAWDVEEYLGRATEAVENAYEGGDVSTEVLEEYDFLARSTEHYHHLFVMSILFYEEAPVEDSYGQIVTKSSEEMVKRLVLLQRLLFSEGIEIPEITPEFFVHAY